MSMMQYLSNLSTYSAEVLLLALGVTVVTSILKKTALRNVRSKLCVVLPFALGLVFYAVFRMIVTASFTPITSELGVTFRNGFACGCASTLYYVVWAKFFCGKTEESPVYPLLEGFVEEEKRAEAAQKLYEGISQTEEELGAFVKETLSAYVAETVTDEEFEGLCALVTQFLLSLKTG